MNVLFIHSVDDIFSRATPLRTPEQMQFGISCISSLLRQHRHQSRLLVLSRMLGERNQQLIDASLSSFSPQLVCFTAVSTEYRFISGVAAYIKNKYPQPYLLIGGAHVSLNPKQVLKQSFDALCIGEGEYPTLELVEQLEKGLSPSGIANLWIKRSTLIEKNPVRPFLPDLNQLPFPDRQIWQEWLAPGQEVRLPVLLGRGCPFQCTYCCNHALRKLAEGRYVRFRSPENIIQEIKELTVSFPDQKQIYLEVETIGADTKWALRLCSLLQEFNSSLQRPLSFGVNLRITPGVDYKQLFAAFQRSNFSTVNIGVESGSERVRREIMHRDYANQDVINAVRLAREHGLKVYFYNIVGIPGETGADFKRTIELNRVCLPERAYLHVFFPYPGTELYNRCKEQGLLAREPEPELERCQATLDLPGFSRRQIQSSFIWFDYHVYKGHKPMANILAKVMVSKFRSNPKLHYLYRMLGSSGLFRGPRQFLRSFLADQQAPPPQDQPH